MTYVRIPYADHLDLAPTPDGEDPRDLGPWGSAIMQREDGEVVQEGLKLSQYFVDAKGNPVLTRDGRAVHIKFSQGRPVPDEKGSPIVTLVDIPPGARVGT
jgi:hypothetical protein